MTRLLNHMRQNAVAYVALFVALGGSGYAAVTLPRGSVGTAQIKNHSITAVKLNHGSIAASIKAWVNVQWRGNQLVAVGSSRRVRVHTLSDGASVSWGRKRFGSSCVASVTPQVNFTVPGTYSGTVTVQFEPHQGLLYLDGFGPDGTPRPQAALVLIVCPT